MGPDCVRCGLVVPRCVAVVYRAPFVVLGLPEHKTSHGAPTATSETHVHFIPGARGRRKFIKILLRLLEEGLILCPVPRRPHRAHQAINIGLAVCQEARSGPNVGLGARCPKERRPVQNPRKWKPKDQAGDIFEVWPADKDHAVQNKCNMRVLGNREDLRGA